jgi:hypothetical protein
MKQTLYAELGVKFDVVQPPHPAFVSLFSALDLVGLAGHASAPSL